jgi:glycosyltransferase involved in cell wall biosynthesis
MVPVKNVTKFVDAMENVITNESARSELIGNAMTRVNDFSWDAVVDKYITLYISSIGKNREY